ncbi:Rne/Rng family ribonuclease [Lipingzhangella sp. LS1_29]|uniref:Rne/Rng family ribonuclease n=1 Tax=Lipingzhangella rawalii TaxID=2055835 RepID=A0ABU2H737_9ACTN|nr:Rne/Rng family ribonuclease [Lipingzhangella rawalii]MDS1271123.1 Rne/Rng family ribonuclease [Lipingzhangella rawalii]
MLDNEPTSGVDSTAESETSQGAATEPDRAEATASDRNHTTELTVAQDEPDTSAEADAGATAGEQTPSVVVTPPRRVAVRPPGPPPEPEPEPQSEAADLSAAPGAGSDTAGSDAGGDTGSALDTDQPANAANASSAVGTDGADGGDSPDPAGTPDGAEHPTTSGRAGAAAAVEAAPEQSDPAPEESSNAAGAPEPVPDDVTAGTADLIVESTSAAATDSATEATEGAVDTGHTAAQPTEEEQPSATEATAQSVPDNAATMAAMLFQPPTAVFQPPAPATTSGRNGTEPSRRSGAGGTVTTDQNGDAGSTGAAEVAGDAGDASADESPSGGDDGKTSRRRRRRGGRGRGRVRAETPEGAESDASEPGSQDRSAPSAPSSGGQSDAATGTGPSESAEHSDTTSGPVREDSGQEGSGDSSTASSSGSGTRRRRRRRRSGSGTATTQATGESESTETDDPPNTVVRVREPRTAEPDDEVRSVRGSTRLEAKKQRRREGREQGRKRPPVITESEFLARREAVQRDMIVRRVEDRTQIAVLEDDVLVEHYVDRSTHKSLVGSVYLGRVQNVLPSMEAAFVDIGKGRNAVLYAGEVNWDATGLEGQPKRIESVLKSGQSVLVQVTKEPNGHKGARLTSQISLPGRYLVYVPDGSMTGISRKLPDKERSRLKQILKRVVPEDAGVIVRTAAEGASEEELKRDIDRLSAQWESIKRKSRSASAPALLSSEPDLTVRVVRDVFNEDFSSLVVAGDEAWTTVEEYVNYVAPHLAERLTHWSDERDVFAAYRVDEQIAKALERKVWLPSGGSLIIDRTEAMTVIDVNTGKFTGQGGNLEETVTKNNLEAAEEIVRQLRLRDIGGIIVIDFIDMVLESNRDLVLRRMLECLARDRTKHQVAEVTSLGLVQMTRKRVGQGLVESFSHTCENCSGRGLIVSSESLTSSGKGGSGTGKSKSRKSRSKAKDATAGNDKETKETTAASEAATDGAAEAKSDPDTAESGSGRSTSGKKSARQNGSGSEVRDSGGTDPAVSVATESETQAPEKQEKQEKSAKSGGTTSKERSRTRTKSRSRAKSKERGAEDDTPQSTEVAAEAAPATEATTANADADTTADTTSDAGSDTTDADAAPGPDAGSGHVGDADAAAPTEASTEASADTADGADSSSGEAAVSEGADAAESAEAQSAATGSGGRTRRRRTRRSGGSRAADSESPVVEAS